MRRPRRPIWGRAAALAALLLVLTGCNAGTEDPDPDAQAPSASPSVDPEAEAFDALLAEHRQVDHDPGDEPTAETAYAELLAENEADLEPCLNEAAPDDAPQCERPVSLEDELQETVNVQLVLDASGSMAESLGGRTKMEVAREVLNDFVGTLPENANVSLRVFGHVGSGSSADKPRSCRTTDLAQPFGKAGSPAIGQAIRSVQPSGWTPLSRAMNASQQDFARAGAETSSNFVYVISDGVETCGGDPVQAARRLSRAGVGVDVNIVGFDVDRRAAQQLRRAARAAGGDFADASSAEDLSDTFDGYDWLEWTRYYNCRWSEAYRDYNKSWSVAYGNYNCIYNAMYREYNAIYTRAHRDYNELYNDAYGEYNAMHDALYSQDGLDSARRDALLRRAEERRTALVRTSEAHRDFSVTNAEERRDTIITAAEEQRVDLIDDATEDRDRILDEVERGRRELND